MHAERWLFGSLIYPAYHRVKRSTVLRHIAEYEANQWLSGEQLRAIQARKLGLLLRHARHRVPYYRRLLEPLGRDPEAADLGTLPPLTKAAIRAAGAGLHAENREAHDLTPNSTSGSTGEPLYFFTDERSLDCRKASVVRNQRWAGIERGDREMRLWGSPLDAAKSGQLRGRVHAWLTRSSLLSAYDMSREQLHRYLDAIEAYRPRLIVSYPSVLEELAVAARRERRRFRGLRALILSAETLYPEQRQLFEQVFRAEVFNRYGSREVGDIAQECAAHDGLHVNADRLLVEIVRDDGSPCGPEESGEVLVTDLENYGMPLIRYAIGDRASFERHELCACGRRLPRLAQVEGRSLDIVRFPNGTNVGGTYWTILLRARPGIEKFQVLQTRREAVTIRYVALRALEAAHARSIEHDVLQRAGPHFRVDFERVEDIPRNASGKRRLVVCELVAAADRPAGVPTS